MTRFPLLRCCLSGILLLVSGCALLMPPTYDAPSDPAAVKELSLHEQALVREWGRALEDETAFESFMADLEALQKANRHEEAIRRCEVCLHAHPMSDLELFDVTERLRYGSLILVYTDSLLKRGMVEQAGRVLQQARSAMPLNPGIRWRSRQLVRIHRRDLLLGDVHPFFDFIPEPNREFVALMRRARESDLVLPPDHDLFGDEMIQLGQWQAAFFNRTYGSALFWSAPYDPTRVPVILVHGINGSPRDFGRMVARFDRTRYQPVFYFYGTGQPLAEASRGLAQALIAFTGRHAPSRVAVVAHSMGGLVTKGVFNQIDAPRDLPAWRLFVSISSPWTGFEGAEKSEAIGCLPDAWKDISPKSPFLQAVHATPMPRAPRLYLFFGARGGGSVFADGSDDGVVPLKSVLESPVTDMAADVFGFYDTHMSILQSERPFRRLLTLLDREMGFAPSKRQ